MDYDMNLLYCQALKLSPKEDLEERCLKLENHIQDLIENYNKDNPLNIEKVYVEQPFIMFSGGATTALTMSKLQRFNGMCCYMIRKKLGYCATLIAANKARTANGIKIKRGDKTKQKIIEWVSKKYPKQLKELY